MKHLLAILLIAAATGCKTTPRPDYSRLDTPLFRSQCAAGQAYAVRVMGRQPPVPIQWLPRPGAKRIGTFWTDEKNAGGRSIFASDKTQCVVYVGSDGGQDQRAHNHEAAHGIDRRVGHDPKWKKHFYNWTDARGVDCVQGADEKHEMPSKVRMEGDVP